MSDNKYLEIKEGIFKSKFALEDFKKRLVCPPCIVLKEEEWFGYDEWRLLWWEPKGLINQDLLPNLKTD